MDIEFALNQCVATLLWATTWSDDPNEANPEPLEDSFGPEDMSDEAMNTLRMRLFEFVRENRDDCENYVAAFDEGHLGHDYALTCERHGAGFWDRGLGDLGERLTRACHNDGPIDLYPGGDGKLYL